MDGTMFEDIPGLSWLGTDWMTVMDGVRIWLDGQSPYLPYTTHTGNLTPPGWYVYPPHSLYLLLPFALLPHWLSFIIGVVGTWLVWEWWVRREAGIPALWTLLWWPIIDHIMFGQFTLIILLALSIVWLCWDRPRWIWYSPLLIAFATIKPQLVVLPLLVILVRAIQERKWSFLIVLTAWMALIWGGPYFVDRGRLYQEWLVSLQTHSTIRTWLLQDWMRVLLMVGIIFSYAKLAKQFHPFYLALALTVCIIPLGSAYSIVGLLFPVLAMKAIVRPLLWSCSLIAVAWPQVSSQGLQIQLGLSLLGLLLSLLISLYPNLRNAVGSFKTPRWGNHQ